ncbi:MAG: OmpA family protein [Pseudomonadota bacterium]|nr:OmpA family protein [Pseudomonadota bacterium]
MSARSFPQLFLLSLLNLLLLAGCAIKGSVRLDPREPEQLIFESEVLVSEDLDPPAAPKPKAPAAPAKREQKHPNTSEDEMLSLETKAEAEPLTREELIEKLTRPIYFALDDASLSDQQKEQLKQLASFLLAPENERLNLRIEGHCDDRGTREYNFALGERRAAVISQQLRISGFPKDRLKTISYGKERLAYSGISEFARARNRRGELILKPDFEPAS